MAKEKLQEKVIITDSDVGLKLEIEQFTKENPYVEIECATHEILYIPREMVSTEKHYYTIFYRNPVKR